MVNKYNMRVNSEMRFGYGTYHVDTFDGHLQRLKRVYAAHKIQQAYKKRLQNRKRRQTITPERAKEIRKRLTSLGFKLTYKDKNGKRRPRRTIEEMRNMVLKYNAASKAHRKRMKQLW